jgi:two-component system sensor histidine kinase RegB
MSVVHDTPLERGLRFLTPSAGPAPDGGRMRLRTLNLIRWIAVAGQTATLIIVHVSLGFELPLIPAFLLVLASIGVNLHAMWAHHGSGVWLADRPAATYLAYDLVQLALLLALTGGLANPFAILILAPVTVSASVLSRSSTMVLAGLAIVAATALGLWHLPLPWTGGGFALPWLYKLGVWLALVLAVVFISAYVFSLAEEKQRMSDALSATQMALAREQRLSALGGLAAAAAHELGSPLGTIAVVARELAQEVPEDSHLKEDADLLLQESARCREILARLAARPEDGDVQTPFHRLPLSALAETAARPFLREGLALETQRRPADGAGEPELERKPEILHAIGTLVQNAARFARGRIELEARWDRQTVALAIRDDGPGFDPDLLPYLGEPYLSGKGGTAGGAGSGGGEGDGENMGLGIFIARTLLARTGAEVAFANRRDGPGAEVTVHWPRARLEARSPETEGDGARRGSRRSARGERARNDQKVTA